MMGEVAATVFVVDLALLVLYGLMSVLVAFLRTLRRHG